MIFGKTINVVIPSGSNTTKWKSGVYNSIYIGDRIEGTGLYGSSLDVLWIPYSLGTGHPYLPVYSNNSFAQVLNPKSGNINYVNGGKYLDQDKNNDSDKTGIYNLVAWRSPLLLETTSQNASFPKFNGNLQNVFWNETVGSWQQRDFGNITTNIGLSTIKVYEKYVGGEVYPVFSGFNKISYYAATTPLQGICDCNSSTFTEGFASVSGYSVLLGYYTSGCSLGTEYPSVYSFSGTTVIPISSVYQINTGFGTINATGILLMPISKKINLYYNGDCTWVSDTITFSGAYSNFYYSGGSWRSSSTPIFTPCPNGSYINMQATLYLTSRLEDGKQFYNARLLWEKVSQVLNFTIGSGASDDLRFIHSGHLPIISETYINHFPFIPFRANTLFYYDSSPAMNAMFNSIVSNSYNLNLTSYSGFLTNLSLERICLYPE